MPESHWIGQGRLEGWSKAEGFTKGTRRFKCRGDPASQFMCDQHFGVARRHLARRDPGFCHSM